MTRSSDLAATTARLARSRRGPGQAGPEPGPGPRTPGGHIPQAAPIRIIASPAVIDAAVALLAETFGAAWQPSTRKPARGSGEDIQYGTLIVPVAAP